MSYSSPDRLSCQAGPPRYGGAGDEVRVRGTFLVDVAWYEATRMADPIELTDEDLRRHPRVRVPL